ncbi:MAG: hypothetical protein IJ087_06055 [Eggerthellaceae bacterium]|nr:hypothetical protein [Eggerthellaceae bacterium]
MQSCLPNGMATRFFSPSCSRSNITSERSTRILLAPTSAIMAPKATSTACIASTASAKIDRPQGLVSARAFSTAGFAMAKAGKGRPVSYSLQIPSGSTFRPSSSKHTVTILYVGKAPEEADAFIASGFDVEGEDMESEAKVPLPDGEDEPCEGEAGKERAGEDAADENEAVEGAAPSPQSKCICS